MSFHAWFPKFQTKLVSTYCESQGGVKRKFEESEAATEDSENPETKAEQQIPAEKKKKKSMLFTFARNSESYFVKGVIHSCS